ncbi:MAG: hypothetical protein QXR62_05035 [Candidatus Bathyarchaeia archaeon]
MHTYKILFTDKILIILNEMEGFIGVIPRRGSRSYFIYKNMLFKLKCTGRKAVKRILRILDDINYETDFSDVKRPVDEVFLIFKPEKTYYLPFWRVVVIPHILSRGYMFDNGTVYLSLTEKLSDILNDKAGTIIQFKNISAILFSVCLLLSKMRADKILLSELVDIVVKLGFNYGYIPRDTLYSNSRNLRNYLWKYINKEKKGVNMRFYEMKRDDLESLLRRRGWGMEKGRKGRKQATQVENLVLLWS